jgi:hypothetical protein
MAYAYELDFAVDTHSALSFDIIGIGKAICRNGDFTGFHVVPGQIFLTYGVRQ